MSLLETLFVVMLLGILAAVSLRSPSSVRGQVQATSQMVLAQLRLAQQLAATRQALVGVGFSRQGSDRAQSCYLLGGSVPHVERALRWEGQCPKAVLWGGWWGGVASTPGGTAIGSWDLGQWSSPHPDDGLIAFTPTGQSLSNLPLVDGAYRLVISSGLQSSSTALGPRLTQVSLPATLSVTPGGAIRLLEGLPANHDVGLKASLELGAISPARSVLSASNQPPTGNVTILPLPASGLPAGVDATCRVGGQLTLQVEAEDADGEDLQLQWSCDKGGGFSHPQTLPMQWSQGKWRADWNWAPPPGTADGELFVLSCQVTDPRGAQLDLTVGAAGKIMAIGDGRIYFTSDRTGNNQIYSMNADGTEVTRVTNDGFNYNWPRVSPDGRKLLCGSDRTGPTELCVLNVDGSDIRQVTDRLSPQITNPAQRWDWVNCSTWSPDGMRAVFTSVRADPSVHDHWMVNLDGTGLQHLVEIPQPVPNPRVNRPEWIWDGSLPYNPTALASHTLLSMRQEDQRLFQFPLSGGPLQDLGTGSGVALVSPDLQWIANLAGGIQVAPWTGSPVIASGTPLPGTAGAFYPCWSPDSNRITFCRNAGNVEIFVINRDGTNLQQITNDAGFDDHPSWARPTF